MGDNRYKIGYYGCLATSVLTTYASLQLSDMASRSIDGPNATLHVFLFFVTVALVALAIYFKYKDSSRYELK